MKNGVAEMILIKIQIQLLGTAKKFPNIDNCRNQNFDSKE